MLLIIYIDEYFSKANATAAIRLQSADENYLFVSSCMKMRARGSNYFTGVSIKIRMTSQYD